MVKNLACPYCHRLLKKTKNGVVCVGCKKTFPLKDNILIFLSEGQKRKFLSDLEFTKKYVQALKKKKKNDLLSKNREFWERERGKSLAAQMVDQKAFETLIKLAGEDFRQFLVLDIGAGGGKEAEILFNLGVKKVVCLDISFDFLKLAKERLKKHNAEFIIADGESLPFKDKVFDLAIFFGSLHHFPHPQKGLKEAARVAKRVALVGEPAKMGTVEKIMKFLGWQTEYGGIQTWRFSPQEIKEILEKEGMEVNFKTNFIWFPFFLLGKFKNNQKFLTTYFFFLKILDNLAGFLGHNLTVFAKEK